MIDIDNYDDGSLVISIKDMRTLSCCESYKLAKYCLVKVKPITNVSRQFYKNFKRNRSTTSSLSKIS